MLLRGDPQWSECWDLNDLGSLEVAQNVSSERGNHWRSPLTPCIFYFMLKTSLKCDIHGVFCRHEPPYVYFIHGVQNESWNPDCDYKWLSAAQGVQHYVWVNANTIGYCPTVNANTIGFFIWRREFFCAVELKFIHRWRAVVTVAADLLFVIAARPLIALAARAHGRWCFQTQERDHEYLYFPGPTPGFMNERGRPV